MNGLQNTSQQAPRVRAAKMSPDLTEVLRMLDALEGQMAEKDAKAAGSR